jgi:hypothetical protein
MKLDASIANFTRFDFRYDPVTQTRSSGVSLLVLPCAEEGAAFNEN